MSMLDVEQEDVMRLVGPGGHCSLLGLLRTASNVDGTSTCVLFEQKETINIKFNFRKHKTMNFVYIIFTI